MIFLPFFERLADTSWSVALHESEIAYSVIESLHVWSLCLFFGMTIMFDLRLLGLTMRKVPVSEVIRRLQPWTIAGFVMMVITGTILLYAIPVRSYQNLFFRAKMLMLLLAGLNVFIFHARVFPSVAKWDADPVPPRPARIAGAFSLALWVCIVISGRMIAYNWFDCDRQPQPDIINFLTSCMPTE
jgi:peptidoglycan/LPS O-acetylase OafA/YrhL